ncbi:hypothetical protein N0V82_005966 [Gnomoniopsis sp. IMI 355080]|nr:hypothetical protein N0V82_005966 [Gnomoniopsis sp. IMI 355080]
MLVQSQHPRWRALRTFLLRLKITDVSFPLPQATYFPISIWTVVELNVGIVAACMPAARLFVTKTAGDIAKSTGFTRFSSQTGRPSYELSGRSSYVKRRSARAAAARKRDSLSEDVVGRQDFGGVSVSRVEEHQMDCEMQRHRDDSHLELALVESRMVDLKGIE